MRLRELAVTDYKGIEISLAWQRVNVVFGPNGAGKTNFLEAIATAFGAADLTRPAGRTSVSAVASLELEDSDDDILASLLAWRDVPPLFPAVIPGRPPDGGIDDFAPARLRWTGRPSGRSFTLPNKTSPEGSLLDDALNGLRDRADRSLKRKLGDPTVRVDVTVALDAMLSSRHLTFNRGVLAWMCPMVDECPREALAAVDRLAAAGWASDSVLGPLVQQLTGPTEEQRPFLEMLDRRALRLFDVVWAAAEGTTESAVDTALRGEFDRWHRETSTAVAVARGLLKKGPWTPAERDYLLWITEQGRTIANTSLSDRWLRSYPLHSLEAAGWTRVLADDLDTFAGKGAAPIVGQSGRILVQLAPPRRWLTDDQRIEVKLWQDHRNQPTSLRDLGSGIQTWLAIAAIEAAKDLSLPNLYVLKFLQRNAATRNGDTVTAGWGVGARRRLLLVDEPEQHLHPHAQREIASWLAQGAADRDTVLATHALPFLDIPTTDAAYVLVTRSPDGVSRGLDISSDIFDRLELLSNEAGLSWPDPGGSVRPV
jgi:energy-coupling factor transporter ATP-binding protein EcfA2